MATHKIVLTQRSSAKVAGYGLLIMTILAILSLALIFQKLIIPDDSARTVSNIVQNEMLFRIGIVSLIIIIICDIVVAWAFYYFMEPVNKSLSLLTAWFRLVYSVIFAAALSNYFNVLQLVGGADYLKVFEANQLSAQVMLSIKSFDDVWAIGYIFFGLHLAFLGYLAVKSGFISRIISYLILIAGISYLIDYFSKFLLPEHALQTAMIFGWGEVIFMVWLVIKGNKFPDAQKDL
jgi:hypothetical protein